MLDPKVTSMTRAVLWFLRKTNTKKPIPLNFLFYWFAGLMILMSHLLVITTTMHVGSFAKGKGDRRQMKERRKM